MFKHDLETLNSKFRMKYKLKEEIIVLIKIVYQRRGREVEVHQKGSHWLNFRESLFHKMLV